MTHLLKAGILFVVIHAVSAALEISGTAFDAFKNLQGKWAIQSEGKTLPIKMIYDVGSKSSIVTEQFGKELSVFYRDGDGLVMTHYCNAGNQPRLRLKDSSRPGIFEFEMFDITNLKTPDAAHVQKIIYTITGDKKMDLEIIWQTGQSQQESEKYSLTKL